MAGPPRGVQGAIRSSAKGSRGPHKLISPFLFLLDVFKEPPTRSSLQGSKNTPRFNAPRFPCFLHLLLAASAGELILQFCPWTSKISRRPRCLVYNLNISTCNNFVFRNCSNSCSSIDEQNLNKVKQLERLITKRWKPRRNRHRILIVTFLCTMLLRSFLLNTQ